MAAWSGTEREAVTDPRFRLVRAVTDLSPTPADLGPRHPCFQADPDKLRGHT